MAVTPETAVQQILGALPGLEVDAITTFFHVCAEDGLSMRALAKRTGMGQSAVMRAVTSLQGGDGAGLVVVRSKSEDSLRQTVHLTVRGQDMKRRLGAA